MDDQENRMSTENQREKYLPPNPPPPPPLRPK